MIETTEYQDHVRDHLRALARGKLWEWRVEPDSEVRLELTAETAVMAMFLMDTFSGWPYNGDHGAVAERLRYLMGAAAHAGAAREGTGFRDYEGSTEPEELYAIGPRGWQPVER